MYSHFSELHIHELTFTETVKLRYCSNTQIFKEGVVYYNLNDTLRVASAFSGKELDPHTLLISRKR